MGSHLEQFKLTRHIQKNNFIENRKKNWRRNNLFTMKTCLPILAVVITFMALFIENTEADGYGSSHGHSHSAKGTACIVKGSYCNCHYCKCEKGHVHCGGYGKGGHGKKYCYGSTQGEYCHCDYCKCKHGYGSTGKGHCH